MNFLIFGGPGIGDTIIELTLAKALKEHYPDSRIDLLVSDSLGTQKTIEGILKCQNYIENCYGYSKKRLLYSLRLLIKLKRNNYDYGFSCSTAFKATSLPARICQIIGCKSIIKEVDGKTGKIDIPVSIPENIHFVEQFQCLYNKLVPDGKLDILVLDRNKLENSIFIKTGEQKLISICLGTNATIYYQDGQAIYKNIKEWGIDRWCELANCLSNAGYRVALLGGKKEAEDLENYRYLLNTSAIQSYVGKTTIKESLSIISQSDIVVGADTGMMHCAAALDVPTVSLFGGTDSNIWRPYSPKGIVLTGVVDCAPCYGKKYAINCKECECMEAIKVENVLNTIIQDVKYEQQAIYYQNE